MKACKLLAWSSKNVEKEAYYYAIEGKLTEFAILLMVAREKVLVPITFSIQDGDDWDGIMTLQQCLQKKLVPISDDWLRSRGLLGTKKTTWILTVLRSAALVLEVVERAGNSLEDYLMFEQHSVCRLIRAPCFVSSYLCFFASCFRLSYAYQNRWNYFEWL